MIKKFGKPVDIMRFKKSMVNHGKLTEIIESNARFGKIVASSPESEFVLKCPICGCENSKQGPVVYEIGYKICVYCGMYYASPRLSRGKLEKYYEKNSGYSKTSYADKETYKYRAKEVSLPKIDFVSNLMTKSACRWLDVGSGIGDVVYNLRVRGVDARGLELSEESIKFSKEVFEVDLEKKSIDDVLIEEGEGSYDVVSYFGVLEHMSDPLEQVERACRIISPGGLLVLEVPSSESFSVLTDSFFKESVVRQMTPFQHIMLFSQKTLITLAEKFSLKAEAMWFIGLDLYNFLLHIGAMVPSFLESDVCSKILGLNNEIQEVFDKKEMSDQILFVARKK